ncbi:hypothetical protein D3C85_1183420 [compost metagenome]
MTDDFANRHAGNQCRAPFGGEFAHHVQVTLCGLLEYRDRSFRPDQQVDALGAETHVAVQRQLGIELGRIPFHALFDIALNRRDTQRRTRWAGPCVMLECHAGHPRADQQQGADCDETFTAGTNQAHAVVDQRCGQGQGKGNQPHATDGGKPGQWAVELAVTGIKPREAGEKPAPERFLANPQRGECQGIGQRCFVAP